MLDIGLILRWILCTPVQFIVGKRFYAGSYHALKRKSTNMDVLVALGTNAAYFYSISIMIKALTSASFEGHYFSRLVPCRYLSFKYLEVMAKGKVSAALSKITDLAPDTAYLVTLDAGGNVIPEIEINTQLIEKNDMLKIVLGAKVPVDGLVIDGRSHVNESMITGEAVSVAKKPGDKVICGTVNEKWVCNYQGDSCRFRNSAFTNGQLVEAAQLAKAPVQKLADLELY